MTTSQQLKHPDWCDTDTEIDITTHEPAFDNTLDEPVTVLHCRRCGAHEAFNTATGTHRPTPTETGPFSGVGSAFNATLESTDPNGPSRTPRQPRHNINHL